MLRYVEVSFRNLFLIVPNPNCKRVINDCKALACVPECVHVCVCQWVYEYVCCMYVCVCVN